MKTNFALHLNELKVRSIYLIFSYFCSFIVCFKYKLELFYFISKKFLMFNFGFIYTNLTEPFIVYLKLIILFSFISIIFFLFYLYGFFFFKSIYNYQIKKILFFFSIFYSFFILFLIFLFKNILPFILKFFILFQQVDVNSLLMINLEAKLNEYFSFFYLFILMIVILTHIPLLILIYVLQLKSFNIIKIRKSVYIVMLLIFLTIAPPDFLFQLLLLPILIIFIEMFFFYFHFIFKLNNVK